MDGMRIYGKHLLCIMLLGICMLFTGIAFGMETEAESDMPESTNVILETGGTSRWWSDQDIPDDQLQRYIVREGSLALCQGMENASMGDAQTLSDFLSWGQEHYPADRNILVL